MNRLFCENIEGYTAYIGLYNYSGKNFPTTHSILSVLNLLFVNLVNHYCCYICQYFVQFIDMERCILLYKLKTKKF